MRTTRRRHHRLAALIALFATTVGAVAATGLAGAGAAPIDDKKKQAAMLEADIEANAQKLAALEEQIKAAQDKLDAAAQTIADAQVRIAAAQTETNRLQKLVRQRAADVYRSASKGTDASIFDTDVGSLSTREKYASAASERDGALMDELHAARQDLATQRHDAETAKHAAENEKAALDAEKADFDAGQAERERLLSQVKGDIATLVAQAAAARRAALAPKNFDPGKLPTPSGRAAAVVSYAEAQLNKPYQYGASGPDSFDCSGLTMASWAQAGVSLPHNSEAQYGDFPHVPMNQLAPGDVVWRPDHVGIYVGNGTVVHATHTGDVVRYIDVSYFQGAARPG